MKLAARIFIFILLFAALNFGGLVTTGFFGGERAAAAIANPAAAKLAAHATTQELVFHYWPTVAAIITLFSALVAFGARLLTFLAGGSLAVGIFIFTRISVTAYQARHNPGSARITLSNPRSADEIAALQRAAQLFPDLDNPNSRLVQEFIRRCNQYAKDNQQYFRDPEWPTKLAREANEAIKQQ